jgi:hypothetical protein
VQAFRPAVRDALLSTLVIAMACTPKPARPMVYSDGARESQLPLAVPAGERIKAHWLRSLKSESSNLGFAPTSPGLKLVAVP